MRIIAGDVGGTKTLLQVVEITGSGSAIAFERRFDSGAYKTFDDLLTEFVDLSKGSVDAACFAVAGPVLENRAEITNLEWLIEAAALTTKFGFTRVSLINDFHAVAL